MVIRKSNGSAVAAQTAVAVMQKEKRMTLESIKKVETLKIEKGVIYGPDGSGKSTFAAAFENPVFISTERGLKGVFKPDGDAPDAFPEAQEWADVLEAVDTLRTTEHGFKTLVIDTADWTEGLSQKATIAKHGKKSIEDFGYGKGYVMVFEEWRSLLSSVNKLIEEKKMHVLFLAHSAIATFNNPGGDNYDRYIMKVDKRIYAVLKEWADFVFFFNHEVVVNRESGQSKGKGIDGDGVMIYPVYSAAYDAKNRYGITDPFPRNFDTFWAHVENFYSNGSNGGNHAENK